MQRAKRRSERANLAAVPCRQQPKTGDVRSRAQGPHAAHYQAITKPPLAITKPALASTKPLPSPLRPLPGHYQVPFGQYQASTKP